MGIKEMPLKEKYERLLNEFQLTWVTCYAFHKEHGTMDKWLEYYANAKKNVLMARVSEQETMPSFKEMVNEGVYDQQKWLPFSNIELEWVSDSEAVIRMRDCPNIKRNEEIAKKAGLDIDPKFVCGKDTTIWPRVYKEFGVDMTHDVEENGCKIRIKLK